MKTPAQTLYSSDYGPTQKASPIVSLQLLLSPSKQDEKQAVGAQAERALGNFITGINLKG